MRWIARAAWPRTRGWLALLVYLGVLGAGIAIAGGLVYLTGHGPFSSGAVADALARGVTKTVPATVVGVLAGLLIVWGGRRLRLRWLAWAPGPIHVLAFSNGDAPGTDADALCMMFRRRLGELRLQAPTSLPGAAPQSDVLDVLASGGGVDSRNPLGSLLNVLRAARPTHAYEVTGALMHRDDAVGCGVTVQVLHLPRTAYPPTTIWAPTWEAAVREAADAATQIVLPGTRRCRDQWVTWRRRAMPEGLLHAYERAAALEIDRRYDEALDVYFDALHRDPSNLALRLQVGKLQEKLGLHLDAYATYEGIRMVARPRDRQGRVKDDQRRVSRTWRLARRVFRTTAHRQRVYTALAARYRQVVLLGGIEFTQQWLNRPGPHDAWTRRDHRREELREGLRPELERMLTETAERQRAAWWRRPINTVPALTAGSRAGRTDPRVLLQPQQPNDWQARLELRELLAVTAIDVADQVRRATQLQRGGSIETATIRLTAICIEQRLAWMRANLPSRGRGARAQWPPDVTILAKKVARVRLGRGPRTPHQRYNAACALAIPLLDDQDRGAWTLPSSMPAQSIEDYRRRFAAAAVRQLELAVAQVKDLTTQRDWLISEDPDFDGLRAYPEFTWFETLHFPDRASPELRPKDVQELESSRHVQALLTTTAQRWEAEWRRRGRALDQRPDLHEVLGWWRDEREAWTVVQGVAVNFSDWETRLDLVTRMSGWGERYGFEAIGVPSPRYETDPLQSKAAGRRPQSQSAHIAAVNQARGTALAQTDARMTELAETLESSPPPSAAGMAMLRDIERWQSRLRQIGLARQEPGRAYLAMLCDAHAGLWQLLREWLDCPDADPPAARRRPVRRSWRGPSAASPVERFDDQLALTGRLWCTTYDWWRTSHVMFELVRHPPVIGRPQEGLSPIDALVMLARERRRERNGSATANG